MDKGNQALKIIIICQVKTNSLAFRFKNLHASENIN